MLSYVVAAAPFCVFLLRAVHLESRPSLVAAALANARIVAAFYRKTLPCFSCLLWLSASQKETEEEEEFLREQARYEQEARDAQEKF